jgi:ABC-type proline/glycine betaine transport system substrate-binding protein
MSTVDIVATMITTGVTAMAPATEVTVTIATTTIVTATVASALARSVLESP